MAAKNDADPLGDEDYDNALDNDNGEDFEGTIEEEELLGSGNYADELKDLQNEGEMSIEELRRLYGYPPEGDLNTSNGNDDEDEEEEDLNDDDGPSSSTAARGTDQYLFDINTNSLSGLDDDDEDYAPPDTWRRNVRVDQERYQAEIPDILSEAERLASDVRDDAICLWSWEKTLPVSDEHIDDYLTKVGMLRKSHDQYISPRASKTRDDEDALCAFFRHGCDAEKALKSYPFPKINAPIRSVRPDALSWDEKEAKIFEESLETYGKDFSLIRRLKLPYRKVGELVEYYYQWKMTPAYRIWREAHPQHVTVVQPHVSAAVVAHALSQENFANVPTTSSNS
ncbi:unnamed protein product [Caenorhabditis bovis]|uniref:ELM2 domain-containing protein n=1 Tax=Caenorhabditis bovis TaxID=2654633 RepID=A0A8S1EVC7_9PELO|nr:unnamed protein product [Caenorhabditis bovis]